MEDSQTMKRRKVEETPKISKSCDTCKNKKIACQGGKPSCSYCQKHDYSCNYSPMKKPGLKPGYGKDFNQRLTLLENSINLINEKLSLLAKSANLGACVDVSADADVVDTSSLALVSNEGDTASSVQFRKSPFTVGGISGCSKTPGFFSDIPLSYSQITHIVQIYLLHTHPVFPILNPKDINVYIFNCSDPQKSPLKHSNCPVILYGIILNSLNFLNDPNINNEELYNFCKSKILLQCINFNSLNDLIALSLLAFHHLNNYNNIESNSIITMINNGLIQLNLNVEMFGNVAVSGDKKLEIKRRIFWGGFYLDRLSSILNSINFKLSNDDLRLYLPVSFESWGNENGEATMCLNRSLITETIYDHTTTDSWVYMLQLMKIFGDLFLFINTTNKKIELNNWLNRLIEFELQVISWKDKLPCSKYLDSNADQTCIANSLRDELSIMDVKLILLYHSIMLKINANISFSIINQSNNFTSIKNKSVGTISNSISIIITIFKSIKKVKPELFKQMDIQCGLALWSVGRILLINQFHQLKTPSPIRESSSNISSSGVVIAHGDLINVKNSIVEDLNFIIFCLEKISGSNSKFCSNLSKILHTLKKNENLYKFDNLVDESDDDTSSISTQDKLLKMSMPENNYKFLSNDCLNDYCSRSSSIMSVQDSISSESTSSSISSLDETKVKVDDFLDWFKMPITEFGHGNAKSKSDLIDLDTFDDVWFMNS